MDKTVRILVMEGSSKQLSRLLSQDKHGLQLTVTATDDLEEAGRLARDSLPQILVIDASISFAGIKKLCRQIALTRGERAYLGVIIVRDEITQRETLAAIEEGVDDFCLSSRVKTEIHIRIQSVLRRKEIADSLQLTNFKLKLANEKLSEVSITDDLTKLHNMRYFNRRLLQEFSRSKRYNETLSVIMFDLDHFKLVNDSCDHLMGSYVLAEVGKLILASTRISDVAARYGGDEFVLMLPETPQAGAKALSERILRVLAEHEFDNSMFKVQIMASFGTATYIPPDPNFPTEVELIRQADQNLYVAKRRGGGCVVTPQDSSQDSLEAS
ncbi:MAG: diguanylate cyclase [Deltaproteobacteria bacterium]|nr:diguanylate cyclase [Deltaproteobacteria bacterium]